MSSPGHRSPVPRLSPAVRRALQAQRPVVALEATSRTQGMPYPAHGIAYGMGGGIIP